jgi:hypothetical protein
VVWVDRATREVALVYASANGRVDVLMAPATYKNARATFAQFIAENHAKVTIAKVNGRPALVIEPHTDACRSNPAWVEFDLNGVDVNIVSATQDAAALLAVANSMSAR